MGSAASVDSKPAEYSRLGRNEPANNITTTELRGKPQHGSGEQDQDVFCLIETDPSRKEMILDFVTKEVHDEWRSRQLKVACKKSAPRSYYCQFFTEKSKKCRNNLSRDNVTDGESPRRMKPSVKKPQMSTDLWGEGGITEPKQDQDDSGACSTQQCTPPQSTSRRKYKIRTKVVQSELKRRSRPTGTDVMVMASEVMQVADDQTSSGNTRKNLHKYDKPWLRNAATSQARRRKALKSRADDEINEALPLPAPSQVTDQQTAKETKPRNIFLTQDELQDESGLPTSEDKTSNPNPEQTQMISEEDASVAEKFKESTQFVSIANPAETARPESSSRTVKDIKSQNPNETTDSDEGEPERREQQTEVSPRVQLHRQSGEHTAAHSTQSDDLQKHKAENAKQNNENSLDQRDVSARLREPHTTSGPEVCITSDSTVARQLSQEDNSEACEVGEKLESKPSSAVKSTQSGPSHTPSKSNHAKFNNRSPSCDSVSPRQMASAREATSTHIKTADLTQHSTGGRVDKENDHQDKENEGKDASTSRINTKEDDGERSGVNDTSVVNEPIDLTQNSTGGPANTDEDHLDNENQEGVISFQNNNASLPTNTKENRDKLPGGKDTLINGKRVSNSDDKQIPHDLPTKPKRPPAHRSSSTSHSERRS